MLFDGHSDILTDVLLKRLCGERDILKRYHLPKMQKGNIEGAIFVFWIDPPYTKNPEKRLEQLINSALEEFKECSEVRIVRNNSEAIKAKNDGKFYIFLGMEGLSGIGNDLCKIDMLYEIGVRHIMLTWNEENVFATGTGGDEKRGLTDLGKKAVYMIENKGILLDVSHLNDKSFWGVVDIATKPLVASHSNSRKLCNHIRNLSDEQMLAIRDTGGVIGINSYNKFVSEFEKKRNIDGFIEHIQYISDKIGIEHVGLGFDFLDYLDGNSDGNLYGLSSCEDAYSVVSKLEKAGFYKKEIDKICRENWLRVLQ